MSRSWSILAPAAVSAILLVMLGLGGGVSPPVALAEDCTPDNTGTLIIEIIDAATGDELETDGTRVLVKPDPRDFELDVVVTDTAIPDANVSQDRDSDTGVIRIEGACSTEGSESYTASLFELPGSLEDCEVNESSDSIELQAEETETLTLEVDCTGVGPTPTATAVPTPGAAATVIANTSPLSVGCNGTSIISITVRDDAGQAVGAGTAVAITTTLGTITAPSQITSNAGTVNTFFTAPSASGGTATITAKAGNATGTGTVNVSCGAGPAATSAPPPTVAAGGGGGGVITPPNTGDAGLVGVHRSAAPMTAAVIFIAITVLGAAASRSVSRR